MAEGDERVVLVCADEPVADEMAQSIAAVGYTPLKCQTARDVELELGEAVIAAVLYAGLPKGETFAIYRLLRARGMPVQVMLPPPDFGRPSWVLEVDHGEQEAYARWPASGAELILRLNALLIRSGRPLPGGDGAGLPGEGRVGGYGKVICIFGAHGGVGKTTVAVNLAVGLVKLLKARVALVDGDLWQGDAVVSLNITATRSILDATDGGLPGDPEAWTRVLLDHPSGMRVLAPPAHLEDVERVPPGAVAAAVQGLRRYFDYVVVDLDDALDENAVATLNVADQVLVVLTPELGAVRNTVRLLTTSVETGLKEKARVVLNRSDAGLGLERVQSVLPQAVTLTIPSDGRLFVAAQNAGLTVFEMEGAARSEARRTFEVLVRSVAAWGRPRVQRKRPRKSMLATLGQRLQRRAG